MTEITIGTVREFYDKHNIEKGNRGWIKRDIIVATIPQFMKNGVLEIGCGCGQIAEKLVKRFPDYTAIDLSPKSIEVAKQTCPSVNFQIADFMEWVTDRKYNTIAFFDSLEHFFDWEKAMEKAVSLLNPCGIIIMNLPHPDFIRYHQRLNPMEHIVDNLIWLGDLIKKMKELHLDLTYYWLYNVEYHKQYHLMAWS